MNTKPISKEEWIQIKIDWCKARLKKLIKLEAPSFVIETEKKLVQKAIDEKKDAIKLDSKKKKLNVKSPIPRRKAYKIIMKANEEIIAHCVDASLLELKENALNSILRGREEYKKGEITRKECVTIEKQKNHLFKLVDKRFHSRALKEM